MSKVTSRFCSSPVSPWGVKDRVDPNTMTQLFGIALTGVAAIGAGLWFLGWFRRISFVETKLSPMTIVAFEGKGPYYKVGEVFPKLTAFIESKGLKSERTVGFYFDDPKTVKESELKWTVGVIVSDSDAKQLELLDLKKNSFFLKRVTEYSKCAKTTFPIVVRPISFMVSAMRVYPAFEKQTEFKNLQSAAIEVYDTGNWTISTFFPQENYEAYLPDKDHGNKF